MRHLPRSQRHDRLQGPPDGELVGAFGVSACTAPLHRSIERRARLVAPDRPGGAGGDRPDRDLPRAPEHPAPPVRTCPGPFPHGPGRPHGPRPGHQAATRSAAWRSLQRDGGAAPQADQDYMEVLAFVSHELSNPIASMITDARVLTDGYLGPLEPAQGKAGAADRQGGHLLELIRNTWTWPGWRAASWPSSPGLRLPRGGRRPRGGPGHAPDPGPAHDPGAPGAQASSRHATRT